MKEIQSWVMEGTEGGGQSLKLAMNLDLPKSAASRQTSVTLFL